MKKIFLALLLLCSVPLFGQQPQTSTAPIQPENTKYVQGVGIGYWPTVGSGLTLNLAAGTAICSGVPVTYAANTLTMTNNTTNYVYLNTLATCIPAVKTTAFASGDIPIAQVITSGGTITTITDVRTFFTTGGNLQSYTVATLPTGQLAGALAIVTDGNGNSCTSGGGSTKAECRYNGAIWDAIGGSGSGITSLNGLNGATQTFANSNDTNVTLAISSVGSIHTFTVGWANTLAVARGGIGVGTLTGIAKGNGTSAFTAASVSDVIGLFSGTCNSSTYARMDGSCQVVPGANHNLLSATHPDTVASSPVLGGTVCGNSTPAWAQLSGPTDQNLAHFFTNTPSGGVAQACAWSLSGVPINAQSGTSYTILNTDRQGLITFSNSSATAVSLPQAAGNFGSNFHIGLANINTGLVTITPTTSTINGGSSAILPNNWYAYIYGDNTNYRAGIFPSLAAFPNCVDSAGNHLNFTLSTGAFSCGTSGGAVFPVTVSGSVNSGGIPCFNSTTNEQTSVALTVNVLVKGGGAGACPTNSLTTDDGTSLTYTGTGGTKSPTFQATGSTAGFVDYPQGSTNAAVAPCNVVNSICEQAPASVTSYLVTRPGIAATGVETNNAVSAVDTKGFSGDSSHSAIITIGSGTSIGSTSLCSTAICTVGTYIINTYVDITTACGTTGTYLVSLIYTDDQGSKTIPININGTGAVPATGVLTTTSASNFGESAQVIRSTGAASINYSTTAVACGTAGPMVGKLYLSVVPVQ